jgi:hypothetical protein
MHPRNTCGQFGFLFPKRAWWKLNLSTRQRWWREINYSEKAPSQALIEAINNELGPTAVVSSEPHQRASLGECGPILPGARAVLGWPHDGSCHYP